MKQVLLACLALVFTLKIAAQDIHFSQITLAPLHQNPALAGVFEGDYRIGSSLRNQWKKIPVPYQTLTFFADGKLLTRGKTTIGGGLLFDSDKTGDAELSWTAIGLNVAVSRQVNERMSLSLGFSAGTAQRKFDLAKLKFKNQFQGNQFDPANAAGENFARSTGQIFDFGTGLNLHFKSPKTRSRFDLGIGAFHLARPTVSFIDEQASRLGRRFDAHADFVFENRARRDFLLFANFQQQANQAKATYSEMLASVGVRRWVKPDELAVSFLLGARFGDAIIPSIRLEWHAWLVGLSYDWNTSGLGVATLGRGGPEVAVQWRLVKVPPVKTFKFCPIY